MGFRLTFTFCFAVPIKTAGEIEFANSDACHWKGNKESYITNPSKVQCSRSKN
jgi:hypothetical protein